VTIPATAKITPTTITTIPTAPDLSDVRAMAVPLAPAVPVSLLAPRRDTRHPRGVNPPRVE
jgi:hypothetical protein